MKIAIIGCSGHYGYALEGIRHFPDSFICGLAPGVQKENMAELQARVKATYPESAYFENYEVLLEKTKPDVVVVNSQFHSNGKLTAAALKAGAHVFAENPVSMKTADLARFAELASEAKRELVAMLGSRYDPRFITMKRHIRLIGTPLLATARISYRLGKLPRFYTDRETFPGLIPWKGSRGIDWIRWLTGREFLSVSAVQSSSHNNGHGQLENRAACQFALTGELIADMHVDCLLPDTAPTRGENCLRIAGTAGIIETTGGKVFAIDANGTRELSLEKGSNIFAEMLYAIQEGRRFDISPQDSLRVSEVALKAQKAADTGRKISLALK